MWTRLAEIVLGLWLLSSPFVFESVSGQRSGRAAELAAGSLIIVLALGSLLTRLRKAHLASVGVALALIAHGYLWAPLGSLSQQNDILIGLVLMMLAILPSEANLPPQSWREYLRPKNSTGSRQS